MTEEKMMRLSQVARKLNVGLSTIADHLSAKGFEVESKPNSKISYDQFEMLAKEFASSALDKEEASGLTIGRKRSENVVLDKEKEEPKSEDDEIIIKGFSSEEKPAPKEEPQEKKEEKLESGAPKLQGIKVVGKIDLDK